VTSAVDVVEALAKAVDEDTWVWGFDVDKWVGKVGSGGVDEGCVGLVTEFILAKGRAVLNSAPRNGLRVDPAEESAGALGDTEEEKSSRRGDGGVDAVLDVCKNGDEDARKEDDKLQRGGLPVLEDFPRRSDEVADSVDDNGAETGGRDVKENRGQRVQRQKNNDGGEDAGQGCPNSSLGLDSSARERPRSRIPAEKGSENVGKSEGDELLGRVNNVIVDATEGLGNRNVLNQKNEDGGWDIWTESRKNLGIELWSPDMLEAWDGTVST
jgi:hypothetical protein